MIQVQGLKTHPKTIARDELARLDIRRYEGPVHLVATPQDLELARQDFRHESVVGLDTETRPAFRKGEVHLPSLVQVATSHTVHVFPLRRLDCSVALIELLENPAIAKTGIGLGHDLKQLKLCFSFREENVVDLAAIARGQGMEQTGVRNLAGLFLGFRVPKGQKTTNWARVELTRHQILYAATDAWVCRELHLCFQKKGFFS